MSKLGDDDRIEPRGGAGGAITVPVMNTAERDKTWKRMREACMNTADEYKKNHQKKPKSEEESDY